ncbi:hypothetical protein GCM10017667_01020 [Streptomyces filamentosus]|uniref:Uncharacterized protein n=1 Tax=Streptomyces filamentosus TaxID=67294 RepID=A0A919BAJ5_STRFL|nr:hypothetical protein GCM10017667_01020 [Streptomyces filamentosus]
MQVGKWCWAAPRKARSATTEMVDPTQPCLQGPALIRGKDPAAQCADHPPSIGTTFVGGSPEAERRPTPPGRLIRLVARCPSREGGGNGPLSAGDVQNSTPRRAA